MTQPEIAALAGCSQSMISDIANSKRGKRLGYAIGERLMQIHRDRFPATEKAA